MGDAQDEQIPTGRLQQGLQPRFKTAPEDEQRGQGTASGHFLIWEASPLKNSAALTHPPTPHCRPHRVLRAYSSLLSFFPRCRGFRFCNVKEWAWVHH